MGTEINAVLHHEYERTKKPGMTQVTFKERKTLCALRDS